MVGLSGWISRSGPSRLLLASHSRHTLETSCCFPAPLDVPLCGLAVSCIPEPRPARPRRTWPLGGSRFLGSTHREAVMHRCCLQPYAFLCAVPSCLIASRSALRNPSPPHLNRVTYIGVRQHPCSLKPVGCHRNRGKLAAVLPRARQAVGGSPASPALPVNLQGGCAPVDPATLPLIIPPHDIAGRPPRTS